MAISPEKRQAICILLKAGLPYERICEDTEVSVRTVKRVSQERRRCAMVASKTRRPVGRPSKASSWKDFIAKELQSQSQMPTSVLLGRAMLDGYDGGKSAFFDLVRSMRAPDPPKLVSHVTTFPGEFSQHDFGTVRNLLVGGRPQTVHFLGSRLLWSQAIALSIVPDLSAESLCRALVDHLHQYGGMPLACVFDNDSAVCRRRKGQVHFNSVFKDMAGQLNLIVEMCWPRSPEQKGSVENLVGFVKRHFLRYRSFGDNDHMESERAAWVSQTNECRVSRATGQIPAPRLAEEQAWLRPLPIHPDDYAIRIPVVVNPMGFVVHDNGRYSMPPEAISVSGTLFLYRQCVRIEVGRWSAEHCRLKPGEVSVLPEHRIERVAAVCGRRGRLYAKREALVELGQPMYDYLVELAHRKPRLWGRDIEELFELLRVHGEQALLASVGRALKREVFGSAYVKALVGRPGKGANSPCPPDPVQQLIPGLFEQAGDNLP